MADETVISNLKKSFEDTFGAPAELVCFAPGRVNRRLWFAAVALGGLCGLAGAIVPRLDILPAVGMALSLGLSLAGLRPAGPHSGPVHATPKVRA